MVIVLRLWLLSCVCGYCVMSLVSFVSVVIVLSGVIALCLWLLSCVCGCVVFVVVLDNIVVLSVAIVFCL